MSLQFTVVVPTYDRPEAVRSCLAALAALEYPRDAFEVIVVDDGSAIPLDAAVLPRADGLAVRILRTANGGPGVARNVGAAAARGRYLAFTDDDCRPTSTWLRSFDASFRRGPDHMVGGCTVNALRRNRWSATSQAIVDMAYDFYNADPYAPRFFASNNMAVPARVFASVGGFSEDGFRVASEDRELCDRWRHAGHGLAYAPDAIVAHAHDLAFGSFCRQHFRYGRGAMRYHQTRARRRSGLLRQDMFFHLQLPRLLRHATSGMTAGEGVQVAWRLVVWQLCNAAGYLYERGRDLAPRAPLPPVAG